MDYQEKTMKTDKLYEGKILNLRIDTVELPNKKYSKREIVEHAGSVAIIPMISDDSLVLVRQYRKAVEDFLLEVPAGRLELNEEPRETAIRELKEETGLSTKKLEYISEFYASPGYCNEKIYLFLAKDLFEDKEFIQDRDEEYIEKEIYTFDQLLSMIKKGDIVDCKTIIAIYTAINLASS